MDNPPMSRLDQVRDVVVVALVVVAGVIVVNLIAGAATRRWERAEWRLRGFASIHSLAPALDILTGAKGAEDAAVED